jgi:hypothetical protein
MDYSRKTKSTGATTNLAFALSLAFGFSALLSSCGGAVNNQGGSSCPNPSTVANFPYPTVAPTATSLSLFQSTQFSTTGGTGTYTYSIDPGGVGTIDARGNYTRPWASTTTTVRASDLVCHSGTSTLTLPSTLLQIGGGPGSGAGTDTEGAGISTDSAGNIYVVGITKSTTLGTEVGSNGNATGYEAYISKQSPTGALLWTKRLGGGSNSSTRGRGIYTDTSGNSIVIGHTIKAGGVALGPELGPNGPSTGYEYFIAKFDTSGNLLWTKEVGGGAATSTYNYGGFVDTSGNIYVTGYTYSSSLGTQLGTQGATTNFDSMIAKHDSSGNLVWIKQLGGGTNRGTQGVAVNADAFGNVYMAGLTNYTALGTQLGTNFGIDNYFLTKLSAATGSLTWTVQIGSGAGGNDTEGYGVTTDTQGNIYATGLTNGTAFTQLGVHSTTYDYFIAKHSPATGAIVWIKQVGGGGSSYTVGNPIQTDSAGNSYIVGSTDSASLGTQLRTHGTTDDLFIAKHDPNGNLLWLNQVGGSGSSDTESSFGGLAMDTNGYLYTTGQTNSSTFGTQLGTFGITYDYFVAKWDTNGNLQ